MHLCACHCVGVQTVEQMAKLEFGDLEWPPGTRGANKAFLRMVLKECAKQYAEAESESDSETGGGDAGGHRLTSRSGSVFLLWL